MSPKRRRKSKEADVAGSSQNPVTSLSDTLRDLYEGQTPRGGRFRYALLAFDLITLGFIVASSFTQPTTLTAVVSVVLGLGILADLAARLFISGNRVRDLLHPTTWADAVAIISFLAPLSGVTASFLRVLRTVRLLHTYQVLVRLRADSRFFRRHEDVLFAVTHLAVFVFVTTAVVFETQHRNNPEIANFVDALYFTVSSLTTTGYGDIVLSGSLGRFLSVAIMIVGVTLFLRLARAVLQPDKIRFRCPSCGLMRHDADAVHCKACGTLLNIPNEGG